MKGRKVCGSIEGQWQKYRYLPVLAFLTASELIHAAGSPFTLKQRVEACDSVLIVCITNIAPAGPLTNAPTIAQAKVLEVLKGRPDLKQINFSYASHGHFAGPASKIAPRKDYVAFLCYVKGSYWVFEGPAGLEAVSSEYEIKHLEGSRSITETLSHSNYLNAIRNAAQPIEVSVLQLLKHRKEYSGKRVEVNGYYRERFEYSNLSDNKEDLDRTVGLWISPFSKPGFETKLHFIEEGPVRVIGVFDYSAQYPTTGFGHLGGWPAALTSLELFEPL